jgi:hypothetical protein
MSTTPKSIWKRMVRPADIKYIVLRPKLWMYFAASRVEISLVVEELKNQANEMNETKQNQECKQDEEGAAPDNRHDDCGPVSVLVYPLPVHQATGLLR